MTEGHRKDYHSGLLAALKEKYDDRYESMETIKELVLGEKVPRLDAVILKKSPDLKLSDEIGVFFKENNIVEFKGYGDGININDFYKVQGYALMYMTVDRSIEEVPIEKMTISILQYRYPRETIKKLIEKGCQIHERSKGIYEIYNQTLFPVQIVNIQNLGEEWDTFKILVPGAVEEQFEKIQIRFEKTEDLKIRQHLSDILLTSIESNPELFTRMKEEGKMSEAIRMVFSEEIKEEYEKMAEESVIKMVSENVPVRKISEWLDIPFEKITEIASKHGFSTVHI